MRNQFEKRKSVSPKNNPNQQQQAVASNASLSKVLGGATTPQKTSQDGQQSSVHKINVNNNGRSISPRKQPLSPSIKKKASFNQVGSRGQESPKRRRYGNETGQDTNPHLYNHRQHQAALGKDRVNKSNNLAVSGASKMITDRSNTTMENINNVTNRLQQHFNEGTQASFNEGSMSNYGNFVNTEHINNGPIFQKDATQIVDHLRDSKIKLGGLMESRSSVLIPAESSQNRESNQRETEIQKRNGLAGDEQGSLGSHVSLPYATDFKLEKIQVRQPKENSNSPTAKQLRKAATNKHVLQLSFKKSHELQEIERQQQSQLIKLHASRSSAIDADNGVSPVIITSLDTGLHEKKPSLIFDVRSVTPRSETRGTPKIGHEQELRENDARTQQVSQNGINSRVTPTMNDADVRLSSPVYQDKVSQKMDQNSVQEPAFTTTESKIETVIDKQPSNFKGLNTMSISLFDTNGYKNTITQERYSVGTSPFRQSKDLKSRGKVPAGVDTKAKIRSTAQRLQQGFKESQYQSRNNDQSKSPQRIQEGLSDCIQVGEIKLGVNKYIKLAEKRLGITRNDGDSGKVLNDDLKFDEETLRDPKKIISRVFQLQQMESVRSIEKMDTIRQAEEIESQNEHLNNVQVEIEAAIANHGLIGVEHTDSQLLADIENVKIQDHLVRQMNQDPNNVVGQDAYKMSIASNQSVLHQRFNYNSDLSLVDSTTMLKPLMTGSEQQPLITAQNSNLRNGSTDLREGSSEITSINKQMMHHAPYTKQTSALNTSNILSQDLQPVTLPIGRKAVSRAVTITTNHLSPTKTVETAVLVDQEFAILSSKSSETRRRGQDIIQQQLPPVPEEQQQQQQIQQNNENQNQNNGDVAQAAMMNGTRESLTDKIKQQLSNTHTSSIHQIDPNETHYQSMIPLPESTRGNNHRNSQHEKFRLQATTTQDQLLQMTQMNLQAISLTKKHMAKTQAQNISSPSTRETSLKLLNISPAPLGSKEKLQQLKAKMMMMQQKQNSNNNYQLSGAGFSQSGNLQLTLQNTLIKLDVAAEHISSRKDIPDTSKIEHNDQSSSLSELRNNVLQPQVINYSNQTTAGLQAHQQAKQQVLLGSNNSPRQNFSNENLADNLPLLMQDMNAFSQQNHEALSQLEARIIRQQQRSVQSQDLLSERPSQLTHLQEPKLGGSKGGGQAAGNNGTTFAAVKGKDVETGALMLLQGEETGFSSHIGSGLNNTTTHRLNNNQFDQTKNSGIDSEKRFVRNSSTQMLTESQLGSLAVIVGKKMDTSRKPIKLNLQGQSTGQRRGTKNSLAVFQPKVVSGSQQLSVKKLDSATNRVQDMSVKGEGIDEKTLIDETVEPSSDQTSNHLGNPRLEQQSVETHPIQEVLLGSIQSPQESIQFRHQNFNKQMIQGQDTNQISGAHTFYNDRSQDNLSRNGSGNQKNLHRTKANSAMVTPMAISPSSPERSMNGDNTEPESAKKVKNDEGFPAPIATETPLRHTRIIFNEQEATAEDKNLIQIKEETANTHMHNNLNFDLQQTAIMQQQSNKRNASNGTSFAMFKELGETANFANQLHSTTGLPESQNLKNQNYQTIVNDKQLLNPLKQSFATTISVIGAPNQSQVIIGNKKNSARLASKFATISSRLVPNLVQRITAKNPIANSHRYSQSIGNRSEILNAGLSIGLQTRNGYQQQQLSQDGSNREGGRLEELFTDKRQTLGGKKLFITTELQKSKNHESNMESLGFALSPLARRGQQILNMGTSRRNIAQTKTPISKLLTENEMNEFQRCLGARTKVQKSPGPYFKTNPQPRENILNQVATSRMISDPADIQKASKLGDITQSGHESPTLSMIPSRLEIQGQIYNQEHKNQQQQQVVEQQKNTKIQQAQQPQQWKSIKTNKPMFGVGIRSVAEQQQQLLNDSQESFLIRGNISPEHANRIMDNNSPVSTLGHPESRLDQKGFNASSKAPKLWQGASMRSTFIKNNNQTSNQVQPIDKVKLVGLKAKINMNESYSKMGLSDLNSVLSSKTKFKGLRAETMIDSSDQADMPEIVPDGVDLNPLSPEYVKAILTSELSGLDQKLVRSDQQSENLTMKPSSSLPVSQDSTNQAAQAVQTQETSQEQLQQQLLPKDLVIAPSDSCSGGINVGNSNRNLSRVSRSIRASQSQGGESSKMKQFLEAKEARYTFVEDQLVQVTKGVLPRYNIELSKKREIADQVRMKYANPEGYQANKHTLSKNKMAGPNQNQSPKQRLGLKNQRRNQYASNQRSVKQSKNDIFVFNDIKNWKKSVQKYSSIMGVENYSSTIQY